MYWKVQQPHSKWNHCMFWDFSSIPFSAEIYCCAGLFVTLLFFQCFEDFIIFISIGVQMNLKRDKLPSFKPWDYLPCVIQNSIQDCHKTTEVFHFQWWLKCLCLVMFLWHLVFHIPKKPKYVKEFQRTL